MGLADLLNATLLTVAGTPVTWVEFLGFASGVGNVWLVARQNIWNWPIGILNVSLYLLIFADSGLYADSALQLVYLALAVYGWWAWLHGGTNRTPLPVSRTTRRTWLWLLPAGVMVTAGLTLLLDRATDSNVPFWDALTTTLSLMATYGQTRKLLESWWLWIIADLVYVPLYLYKDLWLTAVLYVIFLSLCVLGLRNWSRDLSLAVRMRLTEAGAR
ncbi:nicotinamide mononucleotide transporter [Carbonactinospora thermoautotrophica]|uniref:Nicotinamide mononucleotide transporter n=1 Tax=Carbonactinospora thermoautotrophica TaxID=1469144 RepID=A0A132NGS2_9ACTN|nr:nicotinamide riboside transporter PnuC [Carbonactinospora thermoautotrophica]KWW97528.1 nicotinamide mononucleotide transporter [Carbonactinospora thermoautotrophica]KWW98841.1 putative membrane transporter [Carbonactinospora thermoautotrophica]KWX09311.1 nicotinamide mononucleotide transporter [Carbonactinospora thermoautotrophica]